MGKKLLQSRDIHIEPMDIKPRPVTPGPSTNPRGGVGDAAFIRAHATEAELSTFRASVEARLSKSKTSGWRELPGGLRIPADRVLAVCSNCRLVQWVSPGAETGPCPSCNWQAVKGGGLRRQATAAEVKAWYARETASIERFKAGAAKRRAELAAFNNRLRQDGGA